jgi:hypothetical protein
MEFSDIVALRAVFLGTLHKIKQIVDANVYCIVETWVNQNHTHKVAGR